MCCLGNAFVVWVIVMYFVQSLVCNHININLHSIVTNVQSLIGTYVPMHLDNKFLWKSQISNQNNVIPLIGLYFSPDQGFSNLNPRGNLRRFMVIHHCQFDVDNFLKSNSFRQFFSEIVLNWINNRWNYRQVNLFW